MVNFAYPLLRIQKFYIYKEKKGKWTVFQGLGSSEYCDDALWLLIILIIMDFRKEQAKYGQRKGKRWIRVGSVLVNQILSVLTVASQGRYVANI